jgi:hypothetical protein
MKQIILVLFVATAGCNYGSSIADQKPGTTPQGSGGSAGSGTTSSPTESGGTQATASGGVAGTSSGGTTATASGGAAASSGGGSGDTSSSAEGGTGGAGKSGTGGALGTGGAQGSGGRSSGTGGGMAPDAGAGGGSGGSSDTSKADARGTDVPPAGTGGTPGTGGVRGTGGAPGTGGATSTSSGTTACIPAATPGSRGMNTGQACIDCHVAGGQESSRIFTAAGTLYTSASGGTVVSGATVTITGSDGKKVTIVTASDGNFYTSSAIAFPASMQISKCPDTAAMGTTITAGNCNSCHNSSMRLHLP